MKRLKFILLLFVVIGLTNCSNSDDSDDDQNTDNFAELILGSWQPTSVLLNGAPEEGPCVLDWRFTYNNDGTYGSGPGGMGICGGLGGTGLYEVTGNRVLLNSAMGDVNFEYIIQTLNEDTFIYEERILTEGFPDNVRLFTCEKIEE